MSLLIKALQKAEQSKENAAAIEQQPAHASGAALELTPAHAPTEHEMSLAEEGGFYSPAHSIQEHTTEREVAANVFHAKSETVTDPGSRRVFWLGLVGLALLLLLGGGFYVYLETLGPPEMVVARPSVPIKPVSPIMVPPPDTHQVTTNTFDEPPAPVDEKPVSPPGPASVEPVKTTETVVAAPPPVPKPVEKKPAPENDAIKITKNRKAEPVANATAVAAYQAFMAGEDAVAGRLYRDLLQTDPRNVDALLGLAAVASRQGNSDEAAAHYAHALEYDPKNSVAQAGLIALMSQADPIAAESRLKSLLAQQPDAAFLHGALGGVYAEQNQWANAQQSYFQAFRLDPGNAENAFNLAVSLDQLAKPDLALEYYQRTRELISRNGGSIERAALESRINQLRSALGK